MVAFALRNDSCNVQCRMCGMTYSIMYNREDMISWFSGEEFVQDAMPYLSASERELLISGTCGSCFDSLFPPLDTDDDE